MGRSGFCHEYQRALRISGTPGPARCGGEGIEGYCGLAKEYSAGVGECHAATIPLQELDAEPSLELADRARERRLGDREPIGSASEVQFFRDGDEVSKLAGLEIVHVKSLLTDTW